MQFRIDLVNPKYFNDPKVIEGIQQMGNHLVPGQWKKLLNKEDNVIGIIERIN